MREIAHEYVCQCRSTYAVAALAGISRQRVTRILARAGLGLRPRGAGAPRPLQRAAVPADLPGLLRELYLERRLSSSAIGAMLGISPRAVRRRLADAEIPTRHRGNRPPSARRHLSEADLEALYVQAGLSAEEVGHMLEAKRGIVLRNAHETGLPVRVGGPAPRSGPESIEVIDALYSDAQVATALGRHAVPVRAAGGRLHERFPDPVALTAQLLIDLYVECGLAVTHIELLTGRPTVTIQRALVAAGVTLRQPGGRSPFMRRWRAQARAQAPDPALAASHEASGF